MRGTRKSRWSVIAAMGAVGMLALSGCGLQPSTAAPPNIGPGSLQPVEGAEGQRIVITSKNYTEQLILSKIAVMTAEAAGFDTVDMANVPGSQQVRRLMLSGEDGYVLRVHRLRVADVHGPRAGHQGSA